MGRNSAAILVIDSDDAVRKMFCDWFVPRRMEVVGVATGRAALSRLETSQYDLVVLSIVLPDLDGLSMCRELCRMRPVPILMTSCTRCSFDEVSALEAGADDFLVKPLSLDVTLARVRALLRRFQRASSSERMVAGDLMIDKEQLVATVGGRSLGCTPIEFKLLAQLARHPGVAVSRDALVSAIWQGDYSIDRRLVDTHVRNLRRKLSAVGSVLSVYGVRGVGYRLAASGSSIESPLSRGLRLASSPGGIGSL